MIRVSQAIKLAHAKTKSHRILMWLSIIIASLLFAVAVAATTIFNGGLDSLNQFVHESEGDKYRLTVTPVTPVFNQYFANLDLSKIQEMRQFETNYNTTRTAEYQKQGLKYVVDPSQSILMPDSYPNDTTPKELRYRLNTASPIANAFLLHKQQQWMDAATNKTNNLMQLARQNGVSRIYDNTIAGGPWIMPSSNTTVIVDGKENFQSNGNNTSNNSINNSLYLAVNDNLIKRNIDVDSDQKLNGIPVVLSASSFAETFGGSLNISPKRPAKIADQSKWLKDIKDKAVGYTYQVCYRNNVEKEMLNKIQQDYVVINSHSNDKNYPAPSLQYNYPTTPCGDITIKSDARTSQEKSAQAASNEQKQREGIAIKPYHELITFQIVGVFDTQYSDKSSSSLATLLGAALQANTYTATDVALVPNQLYNKMNEQFRPKHLTDDERNSAITFFIDSPDFRPLTLEFVDSDSLTKFAQKYTCQTGDLISNYGNDDCNKPYRSVVYGINSIAINSAVKHGRQILLLALAVIVLLSLIVIWFTIARMIGSSRHETAIYRAIGAKRRDITAIYILYAIGLSFRIAVISTTLGLIIAFIMNNQFQAEATSILASVFGLVDAKISVNLFQPDISALIIIVAMSIITSLVASIQPIITNVLRPPIRDIREE